MTTKKVAVLPDSPRATALKDSVTAAGGEIANIEQAEALVWTEYRRSAELPEVLAAGPDVSWVALPFTGIEPYVEYLDDKRIWTCARGVYAEPVAEMAIAMGLAGLRGLVGYSQATTWTKPVGQNLIGGNVVIFGAGGIAQAAIRQLQGFDCHVTVVRNRNVDLAEADRTATFDQRLSVLGDADLVIIALALTPDTTGVISSAELAAMKPSAWLVNVGRGPHVVTSELVEALRDGQIGGACLDVTDPEPLPDGHALWSLPNVLITPHTGNTPEMGLPLLAAHIERNVRRFCAGDPLEGIIDATSGY